MVDMQRAGSEPAVFGWMLIGGAILASGFAAIHPQLSAHELAGVMQQLAAGATFNGWVHGVLIALNLVLVAGFYGLSRNLGLSRPLTVLALTSYSVGAVAMMSAAVINGFALAMFAGRYGPLDPAQAAAIGSSLNLAGSIAATWAGIGATATSGAIVAWSLAIVARGGSNRVIGSFGIILGIATAVLLVTGTLILNVHGFLLLVASQAIWTVAIGVQLIRGGLPVANFAEAGAAC